MSSLASDGRRGWWAKGEKNGRAKLKDSEVVLMFEYRSTCEDELKQVEDHIYNLQQKKKEIRSRMSKRYIADMFEISDNHCYRIFSGESR